MKKVISNIRIVFTICFLMMFSTLFAGNSPINGDWSGWSEAGDVKVMLTLNVDQKESLNPYNSDSQCNGFITVNLKEQSGLQTLLATYELTLLSQVGELYEFSYKPGRDGMDEGTGKCSFVLDKGTISFQISESSDNIPVSFTNVQLKSDSNPEAFPEETIGEKILNFIISALILLAIIGMLGHMGYVYYKGSRYKLVYNPEMMKEARIMAGKAPESTEEENQQCFDLLEEAYMIWSEVEPDEEGNEMRRPTKMKQIKQSCACIDQAIALQVTSPELLERLNDLTKVININEARSFDGSKALVWLGGIIGILSFFIFDVSMALTILFSTGVYIMASRTPLFLIIKRQERSSGRSMGIVGAIFAMMASAKTVRTVYKFDDGTKAYEDDHSQHWITLVLGVVLLIAVAFFMFFWAMFNYLRNYVLYF